MNANNRFGVESSRDGEDRPPLAGWVGPRPRGWGGSFAESAGDTNSSAPPDGDDPRMVAALEVYLESLREGRPCSRDEYLAQHGGIAESLGECLSVLEFIQAAAEPEGSSAAASTLRPEPVCAPGPARRLLHHPRGRAGGHGRGL